MKKLILMLAGGLACWPFPLLAAEYCREFTRDIQIDGQTVKGYGTSCLQPDGSWKIQAQQPAASPPLPAQAPPPPVVLYQPVPVPQASPLIIHRQHHYGPAYRIGNSHRFKRDYRHRNHHSYHYGNRHHLYGYGSRHYRHSRKHGQSGIYLRF